MDSDNSTTEIISQVTISFVLSVIFIFFFHFLTFKIFTPDKQIFTVINIVMMALFISIFYFTAGSSIEETVLEKQIDYIVTDFAQGANVVLPQNIIDQIVNSLNQKQAGNPALDKQIKKYNNALIKKAMITIGTFVAITAIYVTGMTMNNDVDILPILGECGFILIFIGLTEFLFARYIGGSYYSGDPNMVKVATLKALQQN